jgi:hypothetical protein
MRGNVPPTDRPTNEILEELLAWTRFAHNRAREAGVSQPTVSRLWAKWRRLGLAREIDGRSVHLASPSDLGLSPPP